MEPNETPKKYDLISENFKAIQGLVMGRARQIVRETGLSLGRAVIQAEDEVAAKLIVEPIDGPGLGHWLGKQRAIFRHTVVVPESIPAAPAIQLARQWQAQIEPPPPTNGLHVNQPIQDEDTFLVAGIANRHRDVDPLLVELAAKCKRIQVGEVWSFPVASAAEAKTLSRYLPKVAKLLGWKSLHGAKSYRRQIFPDRLKVKRIS